MADFPAGALRAAGRHLGNVFARSAKPGEAIYSKAADSFIARIRSMPDICRQMEKLPVVYILANRPWGTLYTGVTRNLPKRVYEHKMKLVGGFTAEYGVDKLVYYECFENMYAAISREKQIKGGSRKRKLQLIVGMNSKWSDLYEQILG